MAGRTPRSYAWALRIGPADPEYPLLSAEGRRGLAYARRLAEDARMRRLACLEDGVSPMPLTIAALGELDETSPVRINSLIKQARIELCGKNLSDAAVRYRIRTRATRRNRCCQENGCTQRLPATASASRRYCDQHRSSTARVARHRRRRAQQP